MAVSGFEAHSHPKMLHSHEHIHIAHHSQGGPSGEVEHLASTHPHEHDHAAVEHAHAPHQNFEREHSHEAHIHDHRHPVER